MFLIKYEIRVLSRVRIEKTVQEEIKSIKERIAQNMQHDGRQHEPALENTSLEIKVISVDKMTCVAPTMFSSGI